MKGPYNSLKGSGIQVSFTSFPTVTLLANAFVTKWNYEGTDGMSRCHLSLICFSWWALLSGIAGSIYPPLLYVLLCVQESLKKSHSNGPLHGGGEQENGFSCWCFLVLSLNQCVHAANRYTNASCTQVPWRLVIPAGVMRWVPKFTSSELV